MTEDELQAAELLMALSGAAAPAAAPHATGLPAAKVEPPPSPPPPASAQPRPAAAPAPAAASLAPAAVLPGSGVVPSPGQCLGELGSPAAEVLRQQMMSMLGMAEPPIPPSPSNQGGAKQPRAAVADGTSAGAVAMALRPSAAPPASGAGAPADTAAAGAAGGPAEAADLLSAYQVDSWRVDGRHRGAPGPGR